MDFQSEEPKTLINTNTLFWFFFTAAVFVLVAVLGAWAHDTDSTVDGHSKAISAIQQSQQDTEKRLDGMDGKLDEVRTKLDQLLERHQ
jgi:hypothetical protein